MSINLIFTNDNSAEDVAATNWAAITAIAPNHGIIHIDESTVNTIARLLDGQVLSNGETVTAYSYEEDDVHGALICAFGPSLLPARVQGQVRDLLAVTTNGADAVCLFDEIIRLGLQIRFNGKDHIDARITGINWIADEVEINRTSGNMYAMMRELGLVAGPDQANEVAFDEFAKAVNDNGWRTDMPDRLDAFVACAKRNGATRVYWA